MRSPNPTIFQDLAVRLEAATGPDRQLWCELLVAVLDPDGSGDFKTRLGGVLFQHPTIVGSDGTGSIDAALAFVECVRPNACADIVVNARDDETGNPISLTILDWPDGLSGECKGAATAPLAICLALVRALRQQEAAHGH